MRPRGSPYPSVHANMSIINVYTATPLRVHPAGSCVSSMMIPVRPDLLIVGLGHCARVRHSSRLLRHSVPYPGKPNSSASSDRLRQLVPASTEQICLDRGFGCRRGVNAHLFAFFYTRYLHAIRRTVGPCVGSAGHSCHLAHRRVRLRRKL